MSAPRDARRGRHAPPEHPSAVARLLRLACAIADLRETFTSRQHEQFVARDAARLRGTIIAVLYSPSAVTRARLTMLLTDLADELKNIEREALEQVGDASERLCANWQAFKYAGGTIDEASLKYFKTDDFKYPAECLRDYQQMARALGVEPAAAAVVPEGGAK